jgi:hypothetical protein
MGLPWSFVASFAVSWSFFAISLSSCVCFSANASSHVDDGCDAGAGAGSGDATTVLGTVDSSVVDDSRGACISDSIGGKGRNDALDICC